jgi:plasmid stabilization system protein ParE
MAVKIKWTKRAQISFDTIVEYLEKEWSINSAIKFVRLTNNFLEILKIQPKIGRPEIAKDDLRGFVLSRYTTVFYRIKSKKLIIILKFFDTRQHPLKKWE